MARDTPRRATLADVFDPRANGLNAVRLALAIGVIAYHSSPLTGREIPWAPLRQLLGHVWVDAFFAVSGFLIVGSWLRRPDVRAFLTARALRILPGFWVCLLLTAFVVAPVGVALGGGDGLALVRSGAPLDHVLANAAVWIREFDVGGTPTGVPYEGAWNGSLWTLRWEIGCYVGVLALGVLGLLRRRWVLAACAGAAWLALGATSTGVVGNGLVDDAARFGLVFLCGALVHQHAGRLPASWRGVGLASAVVVLASLLPDYRLLAAPFLAYAVVVTGALLRHPRWRLRDDISYGTYIYAFPVQQLLAVVGAATLPVGAFALLSTLLTLPVAAASWFLVEKPALRLKRPRREAPAVAPAAPTRG